MSLEDKKEPSEGEGLTKADLDALRELVLPSSTYGTLRAKRSSLYLSNPFSGIDLARATKDEIREAIAVDLIRITGDSPYEGDIEEHLEREFPKKDREEFIKQRRALRERLLKMWDRGLVEFKAVGSNLRFEITDAGADNIGYYPMKNPDEEGNIYIGGFRGWLEGYIDRNRTSQRK
ncbi:hypothetical protein HY612_03460 [Candidatus Roizmanbacteria bacterium]|nr:hypothetical protein [Candidatus Roizmanbacteria bacterium]